MAATFVLNTKAEFLKTKKTAAFWITVIGAAFIPIVNFIRLVARADIFAERMQKDPWSIIIRDNWEITSVVFIPMFVIIITSLVVQVDYRNNTWKQVYTTPRTYLDIFFSRFLVIHAMILFCFFLFNVFIVSSSLLTNLVRPQYNFTEHAIPWSSLLQIMLKVYFSVISITAIQYWLSLRFKNLFVPLGIGLALLITGFVIHRWEELYYYPYMYPAIEYIPNFKNVEGFVEKAHLYNGICFTVVLLLAFFDISRRKERG